MLATGNRTALLVTAAEDTSTLEALGGDRGVMGGSIPTASTGR